MISKGTFIDSVEMVHKYLIAEHDVHCKISELRKLMKNEMSLSYRKVSVVPIQANMERNRVIRQQFAMIMIDLLLRKKRVVAVDETFLGMSDFRN